MLSQNDLSQISRLLDGKLSPFQKGLDTQEKILDLQSRILNEQSQILENHTNELKKHGKLLGALKKDQNLIVRMLDREQMDQRKRLIRIEERLGISSNFS